MFSVNLIYTFSTIPWIDILLRRKVSGVWTTGILMSATMTSFVCMAIDKYIVFVAIITVEIFTRDDELELHTNCCCTKVELKIVICSKNKNLLKDVDNVLINYGEKKNYRGCMCHCLLVLKYNN